MIRIALLIVFALALIAPSEARAYSYAGQTPLPPMIDDLVDQADAFWIHHDGADTCPDGVQTWQAPSLLAGDGIDAAGRGLHDGSDCELWLSTNEVSSALNPLWWGNLLEVCIIVAHEDGHARGHTHTPAGIMAGTGWPGERASQIAPRFCIRWARIVMREYFRGEGYTQRQIAEGLRLPD